MKRRTITLLIYAIIIVVMLFLLFLPTETRTVSFWIGLFFLLLSLALSGVLTAFLSGEKNAAFPITLSMSVLSCGYVLAVLIINIVFERIAFLEYKAFLGIHVIGLSAFTVIELLMLIAKSVVSRQNDQLRPKIDNRQQFLQEAEAIKGKMERLPEGLRDEALKRMEILCEALRYSGFSSERDTAALDSAIHSRLVFLSGEIDNLIDIQSEDGETVKAAVADLKQLIAQRNRQLSAGNTEI